MNAADILRNVKWKPQDGLPYKATQIGTVEIQGVKYPCYRLPNGRFVVDCSNEPWTERPPDASAEYVEGLVTAFEKSDLVMPPAWTIGPPAHCFEPPNETCPAWTDSRGKELRGPPPVVPPPTEDDLRPLTRAIRAAWASPKGKI